MEIDETVHAPDRETWRAWLDTHHDASDGIWMLFYKKHTDTATIAYDDAVEEALCFGWIDSIIKRVDEDRYVRWFSPRRNSENWSPLNQHRVAKMARAGKMTDAGWAQVTFEVTDDLLTPPPPRSAREAPVLPPAVEAELRANAQAWEAFENLSPSERRRYTGWISSAKREATQMRRLAEAIDYLIRGEPLGMK